MCFSSNPPLDPTTLCRGFERNFRGLLPLFKTTLYFWVSCSVLSWSLLQNQRNYWANAATPMFLTPYNIIISQIKDVQRSHKKKKHSALMEWHKFILWLSYLFSRRKKAPELLKQYREIFCFPPSKACVNVSLIFFSYGKVIFSYYSLYLASHFADLQPLCF